MDKLKIIIPVDFSEQSQFALQYAKNLNKSFETEVALLHVMELSAFAEVNTEGHFEDFMGINAKMLDIKQKEAAEKLNTLHESERGNFPKCTPHMKLGPLTETIVNFAHRQKADLILMGTKGAEKLRAWISGSETQVVARHSEIPVLTVMCDRPNAVIDDLLFISDFRDAEVAPDPVILKLQKGLGAKLHLLCIATDDRSTDAELQQCMEDYASAHSLAHYEIHIHHYREVVEGISTFDRMGEMDLIAIGTHGRKGINHLIRGSIAEKLINQLFKPVLVYKI